MAVHPCQLQGCAAAPRPGVAAGAALSCPAGPRLNTHCSSPPALVGCVRPRPAPTWPPSSNSEIYNHQQLRDTKLAGVDLHSRSDSAVVGYLYQKYGDTNELWNSLDGIFACVIWDERTGYFCAARDPIGICSLYWGRADDGSVWFASEMKALQTKCTSIECFPPVSARRRGVAAGPGKRG